jgi:uncharacterized protein
MKKVKNTLLWEITHFDSSEISYLFGTMHLLDERALLLLEKVTPFLSRCPVFAAETSIGDLHEISSDFMYLPDNQTLGNFFTKNKTKKIANAVEKYLGTFFPMVERLYPMFLTNIFSTRSISEENKYRLDDLLWQFATTDEKKCVGVESANRQVEIFSKIPLPYQCKQLADSVKKLSKGNRTYEKMADLYFDGELLALYQYAKKGIGKLRRPLVYERNTQMTTRIIELIGENPTFIAIGAGHLAGYTGVIRQLEKKGFTLRPVAIK